MAVNNVIVGIDATRARSGGAKSHLLGVLGAGSPQGHGIEQVHIWSYRQLLDEIPNYPWLVKHSPTALEKSLVCQLWWQLTKLRDELKRNGCNVLLSTDAGTLCHYQPDIVMSRDMLSFEPGEIERYFIFSYSRVRLWVLKWIQARALKRASAVVFLTNYASSIIMQSVGPIKRYRIINHGVSEGFRAIGNSRRKKNKNKLEINCCYVSNADFYKHQWNVIEATSKLRANNLNIKLHLVGASSGIAAGLVREAIRTFDPKGEFVMTYPFQDRKNVIEFLHNADIFVFASSCENMPNTLVEAMASGLPIACSNRGPMPEVLQNCGVYFDPESPVEIASAVNKLTRDLDLREYSSQAALERSRFFSWERCADETWRYLYEVALREIY